MLFAKFLIFIKYIQVLLPIYLGTFTYYNSKNLFKISKNVKHLHFFNLPFKV